MVTGTSTTGDETTPPISKRPTRADAARNYDRLVAVARELFHTEGIDVALDKVAGAAGVGIGTLYRHFPNRAALLEATFRSYTDDIVAATWRQLDTGSSVAALEGIFEAYMSTAATKKGMKEAILAAVGDDAAVFQESRGQVAELMSAILERGRAEGLLRDDIEAEDLQRLVGGLSMTCGSLDTREARARLIGVVIDGLRPPS